MCVRECESEPCLRSPEDANASPRASLGRMELQGQKSPGLSFGPAPFVLKSFCPLCPGRFNANDRAKPVDVYSEVKQSPEL